MSIYSRKQRWKIWLSAAAILIIVVSLRYTNVMVEKISNEERTKVELWADAVRNRATLVQYTENLFNRLKAEERKRAEIWAEATRNLSITEDDEARSFYLKVVSENNTIPAIIVDQENKVNYITNADTTGFGNTAEFRGKIREAFSAYQPIIIDDGFSNRYYIYYQDSKVFADLRDVMDNIIQSFISEVVVNAASVPVIITDSAQTRIVASGNLGKGFENDTTAMLQLAGEMLAENTPLKVDLPDYGKCSIYYRNSFLLTQLKYYPVIQFSVITLFLMVAYFMFSFSRRAEQNQVWVGMSKETAHQLGTPLSSLIAWMEMLRIKGVDEATIAEMNKDIRRLEIITERFSKIGSIPELAENDLELVLRESLDYMRLRTSKKIGMALINHLPEQGRISVRLNQHLFEWVIENLFRNAIDAMEGHDGNIKLEFGEKGKWVYIDISDTGKGIPKAMLKTVFEPGYTSKKRGWGLGLSLSKRIIENYHKGKIFVKKSEPGKGSTFRILLPR